MTFNDVSFVLYIGTVMIHTYLLWRMCTIIFLEWIYNFKLVYKLCRHTNLVHIFWNTQLLEFLAIFLCDFYQPHRQLCRTNFFIHDYNKVQYYKLVSKWYFSTHPIDLWICKQQRPIRITQHQLFRLHLASHPQDWHRLHEAGIQVPVCCPWL